MVQESRNLKVKKKKNAHCIKCYTKLRSGQPSILIHLYQNFRSEGKYYLILSIEIC